MSKSYIPSRDAALIPWAANIASKISSTPTAFGLTAAQATTLSSANTALASAYATAIEPSTRTRGTIAAKNAARAAFKTTVRGLVAIVQKFPGLTNTQRADLGITIPAPVRPINPPTESPVMEIVSINGRNMKLKLHGVTGKGKPAGVKGASLFSFVGATPPSDIASWTFEGSTTRTNFDVTFAPTIAAGSQVWLTAFWFNPRAQSGPACTPVSGYIAGGVAMAA